MSGVPALATLLMLRIWSFLLGRVQVKLAVYGLSLACHRARATVTATAAARGSARDSELQVANELEE